MKPTFTLLAALTLLSACASRPSAIAPSNISSLEYANLTCEQTTAELELKRQQLNALEKKQKSAATADAVGVFLVLVPVSTVFGGDHEGEVAQAKGEVLALERAIPQNCKPTATQNILESGAAE